MKLKNHYARFKIMTSYNLCRMFSQAIMLREMLWGILRKHSLIGETGHYFQHCYALTQFLHARLNQW